MYFFDITFFEKQKGKNVKKLAFLLTGHKSQITVDPFTRQKRRKYSKYPVANSV